MPTDGKISKKTEKSFLKLYDRTADAIFRHCFFRLFDRELAKEFTQEIFLRGWKELTDTTKEVKYPKALLYKIANNLIIDYKRKKHEESLETMQANGFDPAGNNFKENIHAGIEYQKILEKIDKLPEILTTTEQKTRKVINKIINEIDSKCKTYGILTNPRWLNNKELLTFKLKEYPSYPHECDLSKLYIYKYTINIDTLEVEKEELISTLKNSGIFSPDGTQITIIGSEDNRIEGIYIMNIDGSNKRKLVDVTQLPKGDPDYLW